MDINTVYNKFNEDIRLNNGKASTIEFITTKIFISKYLDDNKKIIELGAATGAYSLHYAKLGYDVTAIEPVEKNINILKSRITPDMKIKPYLANALDLSFIEDESYDIVLCLGPLYHLDNENRLKCLQEAKRICKKGGIMFLAYLSNDMCFATEAMCNNPNFLGSECYNHAFHKLTDNPFYFMTIDEMNKLVQESKLNKLTSFAAEGLAELLRDKINAFSDAQFDEWLKFHLYTCEKPELFGYSNHVVCIVEKQ